MKVLELPIDKIFVTKNVRLEKDGELGDLMQSIGQHELLQPIGVFPRDGGRYEVVWGHRRLAAAKLRNDQTIASRILHCSESDIPLIKLQENVQRKQLSAEEIVAAADELKRRRPGLTDQGIDKMLGKQPGYLSNCRSTANAAKYLIQHGLKKEAVDVLTDDELREMRAKLELGGKEHGTRKSTFHRGTRTPAEGFRIVNSPGPNVVVICADGTEKLRVLRTLRNLQNRIGA